MKVFHLTSGKRKAEKEKFYTEQHKEKYAEQMERCVLCGAPTDVPVMQSVNERKCYVPGAGQLCRKCCMELYGTDDLGISAESEFCKI